MRYARIVVVCAAVLSACSPPKKQEPVPEPAKPTIAAVHVIGPIAYVGTRSYDVQPGKGVRELDAQANAVSLLSFCSQQEGVFLASDPNAAARSDNIAQCAAEHSVKTSAKSVPAAGEELSRSRPPPDSFTLTPNTP